MSDEATPADREAAWLAWRPQARRHFQNDHHALAEAAFLAGYDASAARLGEEIDALLKWLELICESQDIDPAETFVRANAVNRETHASREVARVSLAQSMDKARAVRASTPGEGGDHVR